MRLFHIAIPGLLLLSFAPIKVEAQSEKDTFSLEKTSLAGLSFRCIGPAVTGGRIIDIEVNPADHSEYYAASGHGSLWKTSDGGVTFKPVFDGQDAYAMGAVTISPANPNVVWVGTGENNAHSLVLPGNGIYKSEDGGKSWQHKGLEESQHIGEIVVHPNDPNIVWVAAYGPHRTDGGERGIYKSVDGGENWKHSLDISPYTGCWELHMDPRDPDILYAVAHQRQRYLYTIISGGDESGIYKTTDGGENWTRLKGGLPQEQVGRIGMDISPVDPDVLFAVVHASEGQGIYKSTDRGASWSKQSSYSTAYPFYMQKIYCDTRDIDRIYAMDIVTKLSTDGGKTWDHHGDGTRHVDDHTLWIDPDDNRHLRIGCDGGVYESYDQGNTWDFKNNIPIAEIYKVTADNAKPFYNVFIGTQDNNSLGGPSRTINSTGIVNSDWFFTWGGDGFETVVDWKDPNIIYSQSQYGGLARYDRRSGERLYIKAYELGDTAYRFDWDAALIISNHDHKRLYHGANKVLRTDDQGSTWREISPDLTRGVPKEILPLMDRSWSMDEMASKGSLAHIVSLAESPLNEEILYAGSGDGLLHYTHDGGENWKRAALDGLPEFARIHHIIASSHGEMVAYAACHNVMAGDFEPYLYKTTDGGVNWSRINANLPKRGSTYTIGEDHMDPDLLFVGTMYGVFVSNTEEPNWVKLSNGIPKAVPVWDLDLQREEDDLVVSTFGRGVWILDDYSPLRQLKPETLEKEAALFPVADAKMFVEADPFAFKGVGFQGSSFYSAPNPEVGAPISWYIKEKPKSLQEQRREKEKELQKEKKDIKYPAYSTLKMEAEEEEPFLFFIIEDEAGNIIRKIRQPLTGGVHRLTWDFRYAPVAPVSLEAFSSPYAWVQPDLGHMVAPGTYSVSLSIYQDGELIELAGPQSFECKPLNIASIPAEDLEALDRFNKKVARLSRSVNAANAHRGHLQEHLPYIEKAILQVPAMQEDWLSGLSEIRSKLRKLNEMLNGDPLLSRYEGGTRTSLSGKLDLITGALWSTTAAPTSTFERAYEEANASFGEVHSLLTEVDGMVGTLEDELEEAGAPYTPGRLPSY